MSIYAFASATHARSHSPRPHSPKPASVRAPAPNFFPKQENNKVAKGAKAGDYQKINAGAVKVIYKKVIADDQGNLTLDPSRVAYFSESILGRRELQGEVATAVDIEASLRRSRSSDPTKKTSLSQESYIQTHLAPRADGGVDAPAAIGDLDGFIKKPLSLKMRLGLCRQVVLGMENMQKAGYVTGDAKLENILVFSENGRVVARLSDFGKAIRLSEGSHALMMGNGRFAAPEGLLSREAEVFSTALMVIRIIEEGINPEGCEKYAVKTNTGHTRRGIEGRLLQEGRTNKKGVTGALSLTKKYLLALTVGKISQTRPQFEENLIHRHIDELSKAYFLEHSEANEVTDQGMLEIFSLLKDMTKANPLDRPSLETVHKRLDQALHKLATV